MIDNWSFSYFLKIFNNFLNFNFRNSHLLIKGFALGVVFVERQIFDWKSFDYFNNCQWSLDLIQFISVNVNWCIFELSKFCVLINICSHSIVKNISIKNCEQSITVLDHSKDFLYCINFTNAERENAIECFPNKLFS
jgi:hypothetical protein